jgi:type IV secretion system protein VirD4
MENAWDHIKSHKGRYIFITFFFFLWLIFSLKAALWIGGIVGVIALISRGKNRGRTTKDTSHGSARWALNRDVYSNLASNLLPDRFVFGYSFERAKLEKGQSASLLDDPKKRMFCPIITSGTKFKWDDGQRWDDSHVVTIAGTGEGKGISVVIPNLAVYGGSAVVFDPKGENFLKTARLRMAMNQDVYLLDPFGAVPANRQMGCLAKFNPLDYLAEQQLLGNDAAIWDEAGAIADMLIATDPRDSNKHFDEKAKQFLKNMILFVTYAPTYQNNRDKFPLSLPTVMDCMRQKFETPEDIEDFRQECLEVPQLRQIAPTVRMIGTEEIKNVLSFIAKHTDNAIDSPAVRPTLASSDFRPGDIKHRQMTIYFVLPANRMSEYRGLARLWIGSVLQAVMRDTDEPTRRILFMLDEMAQLGKMEALEKAVSLARGYGMDLWMLFQDINQIKAIYEQKWETFIGNARTLQCFGIHDQETAQYVSSRLGQSTIQTTSYNENESHGYNSGRSWGGGGENSSSSNSGYSSNTSSGYSVQSIGRPLLTPDEVRGLPAEEQIVWIGSQPPVRAAKFNILLPPIEQAIRAFVNNQVARNALNPRAMQAALTLQQDNYIDSSLTLQKAAILDTNGMGQDASNVDVRAVSRSASDARAAASETA